MKNKLVNVFSSQLLQVATASALFLASFSSAFVFEAQASIELVSPGQKRAGWVFKEAGVLPVFVAGRLKPVDTMARETVMFITGSRTWGGWEPLELLLSWVSAPQVWETVEFVQVNREDVRKQLGLDPQKTRFSPKELVETSYLSQYADKMPGGAQLSNPPLAGGAGMKQHPRDQELARVLERVGAFRGITSGEAWLFVPRPEPQEWQGLTAGNPAGASSSDMTIRLLASQWISTYAKANLAEFAEATLKLQSGIESQITGFSDSTRGHLYWEAFYNRVRPFMSAWIFYVIGALLLLLGVATRSTDADEKTEAQKVSPTSRFLNYGGLTFVALGFFSTIGGIWIRVMVSGRPPVTNMYESMVWVSFGCVFFAWILYFFQKQTVLLTVAAAVGGITLIIADSSPALLDPGIHPLVPVLKSNYWLTIHVLTITLGYAAFALTLGLGNVGLYHYIRGQHRPGAQAKIFAMNALTYRAMMFGVVLLAAGTILGGVWADYSWGRFWGWDPKEVWALIALLGYVTVLHARYTGWMGQFGFTAWTVISFLLVVMAWYGVNFVLGVGLHSYGFSSGGQAGMAVFSTVQLSYVALAAFRKMKSPQHAAKV